MLGVYMKLQIVSMTDDPAGLISFAAGVCYGKRDRKKSRVKNCYNVGHTGIFEHACVSFLIEGISRSCSIQVVRQRMASYCQESQRYCKYNLVGDDWYVIPDSIIGVSGLEEKYREKRRAEGEEYMSYIAAGVPAEDARYALPEATKTTVLMTVNFRELFHFFDLRLSKHAQWEIRDLAKSMHDEVMDVEPYLIEVYDSKADKTLID